MYILLQSGASVIGKWDSFDVLQSRVNFITKWGTFLVFQSRVSGIIKWGNFYYKVRLLLKSRAAQIANER